MSTKKIKLFGTDGIRGDANQFPMLPDIVIKVGKAIGVILKRQAAAHLIPKVVIGKDTRLSGYMLEMALTSGLLSTGVEVQLVGPLPTPGVSFITRNMRASVGIVISASHNSFHDNGIKIFGADGFKIPDAMEEEIERLVSEDDFSPYLAHHEKIGRSRRIDDAQGRYIVYVKNTLPNQYTLDGLRIVLDTANGAAYKIAPAVFSELGAEVIQIGNTPNGLNINDECGALYPDIISEAVLKYRADVGISLDGDADRVMMADEFGRVINGDHIMGLCALNMKQKGMLRNNTLVVTHMSNYGLEKAMRENGINLVRAEVGDKHVVDEMRRLNASLGGEQSGHVIHLDHSTTGDGCIAALNVLAIMKETGKKMSELNRVFEDVPQKLINVKVANKTSLDLIKGYPELIQRIESQLNGQGRTFVRFSGTEPLARVLVEGNDKLQIDQFADEIADLLKNEIG
ncbi:phosphoglucosamine mutase [Methylomicrobium sp. Wu6]|uniref:phosphoglucosamine mutase n=1 Tax=Methylomicrobium sp. Wu6 TaxID=3107928 RepID=UPI002DD62F78|nr:phosphoglucosamine mutase [Methylomicrobium sp. Wu6]MEC4749685.1 phosphoglucosamine mutase [Methylomicrobium sp. Wu6]